MSAGQVPPLPQKGQARKAPSLLSPMVLSAVVCPGAGQLMQRRWGAGIFFLVSAGASVIWLVGSVYAVLKDYYGLAFAPMNAPVKEPDLSMLIIPFVTFLVLYVAGLVDTAVAAYRIRLKHPDRR